MYKVILLTLFASASAYVTVNSTCPEYKTADNFDFNTFARGKWYEFAAYPMDSSKMKCTYWDYTLEGESAKAIHYSYVDGEPGSSEVIFRPVQGATGRLTFNIPKGPSTVNKLDYPFNVLAIDNKNYVLAYACKNNEDNGPRLDYAWIFTRLKTPTKEVETVIDNTITSLGFLDKSKFIKNDYTDELCKNV